MGKIDKNMENTWETLENHGKKHGNTWENRDQH
jgi:hypothetical protein